MPMAHPVQVSGKALRVIKTRPRTGWLIPGDLFAQARRPTTWSQYGFPMRLPTLTTKP